MKLTITLLLIFFFSVSIFGQENLIELKPHKSFDNILIKRLSGDNLSTQFVIWVKDTVKTHKHENHSESLYVIEGSGTFFIGENKFSIKPGDFISIPKNEWHSVKVTSDKPLKVLSVQSPSFYGKDRVFKD